MATVQIIKNGPLAGAQVHYQLVAISDSVVVTVNLPIPEAVEDELREVTFRVCAALHDVVQSIDRNEDQFARM